MHWQDTAASGDEGLQIGCRSKSDGRDANTVCWEIGVLWVGACGLAVGCDILIPGRLC